MSSINVNSKVFSVNGGGIVKTILSIDENTGIAICQWKDPKTKEIKDGSYHVSDLRLKREGGYNINLEEWL